MRDWSWVESMPSSSPELAAWATERLDAFLLTTLAAIALTLVFVRPAAVAVPNEPRTRATTATTTSSGRAVMRDFFMMSSEGDGVLDSAQEVAPGRVDMTRAGHCVGQSPAY